MRYVKSRFQSENQDLAYRIYVTDSVKSVFGLNRRYYDLIKTDFEQETYVEETRTPEEIKKSIMEKIKQSGNREEEKEDGHNGTISEITVG